MKFIPKLDRHQTALFPKSLDESVSKDNEVRIIDFYVDTIDLKSFGFKTSFSENGRPGYQPSDLLKLYIYGYLNRIRSSRALERECSRNIELIWLLGGLVPDHNTISNFRRDNQKGIKKVFRNTVKIAKDFNLIGALLLAVDSSRFPAQNSKGNNFTLNKIEQRTEQIDKKLEEYNNELGSNEQGMGIEGSSDVQDICNSVVGKEIVKTSATTEKCEQNERSTEHQQVEKSKKGLEQKRKEIERKRKEAIKKREEFEKLKNEMIEKGDSQISTSDPDSRLLASSTKQGVVGYNVQIGVDEQHKIIVDFKVTSENDRKAMGEMGRRLKTMLGQSTFTILFDKGYHTGSEFEYVEKHGINVLVGSLEASSHAPDHAYDISQFKYDIERDEYICPAGKVLTTNGKEHNKIKRGVTYKAKRYRTSECHNCPFKSSCTKRKDGRLIERSEYLDYIDANRRRLEENMELYRQRQAIVEHPFGTIKRQWGYNYIITKKSRKRAEADIGLILTTYNLRRLINILGFDKFKAYLEARITKKANYFIYKDDFKMCRVIIKVMSYKNEHPKTIVKMSPEPLISLKRA